VRFSRQRCAAAAAGLALVVCASCAGNKKKVELIYEEPVTNVWTDRGAPPAAPPPADPAPPPAPAPYPAATPAPSQVPPGFFPPAQAAPADPNAYPPSPPSRQTTQQPPPAAPQGWRGQQPPPQPPPTGFPDPSVTTVVVPDQNPTTQTTLRRRTGWVRGGYD
jgi:hypothetical protein